MLLFFLHLTLCAKFFWGEHAAGTKAAVGKYGKWHGYDCGNGIYGVRKGILVPCGAEVYA
ncbi:MAG: hypothetical protein GZ091_08735 [Paludibacter sp.]|nr:hypothetical protein [Paludibacter sp.]